MRSTFEIRPFCDIIRRFTLLSAYLAIIFGEPYNNYCLKRYFTLGGVRHHSRVLSRGHYANCLSGRITLKASEPPVGVAKLELWTIQVNSCSIQIPASQSVKEIREWGARGELFY